MKYVFIEQTGTLSNYAKPLSKRKNKTGFKRVQDMQIALDETVRQYQNLPATAENSEELWKSLEAVGITAAKGMTNAELECEAFKEIEEWLGRIGDEIAFIGLRRGISEMVAAYYYHGFLAYDRNNEDFIDRFFKFLVCYFSRNYKNKKNANTILWNLSEIEDEEELYEVAIKWQDGLRANCDSYLKKHTSSNLVYHENEEIPF